MARGWIAAIDRKDVRVDVEPKSGRLLVQEKMSDLFMTDGKWHEVVFGDPMWRKAVEAFVQTLLHGRGPHDKLLTEPDRLQDAVKRGRDVDEMTSDRFDFGEALRQLKLGRRVTRSGWNGKGMYLELQVPDAHSKMSLPYIYMKTVDDKLVPWVASQTDMLADDWGYPGAPQNS